MTTFASRTSVPVEKSKAEIERILERYGASAFGYSVRQEAAEVVFVLSGRHIRFSLPLPSKAEPRFRKTPTGRFRPPGVRTDEFVQSAWEQACRQKWRALALAVKAKLETVESGIATLEEEFLAYIVLPSGETFSEWAVPQMGLIDDRMMPRQLTEGHG